MLSAAFRIQQVHARNNQAVCSLPSLFASVPLTQAASPFRCLAGSCKASMQLLLPFNTLRMKPVDSMTGSIQLECSSRVHTPQQPRCFLLRPHRLAFMPQHTGALLHAAPCRGMLSTRRRSLHVSNAILLFGAAI
jgi:hypothetical protein